MIGAAMLSEAGTGRRAGLMRLALLAALGAVTATGLAPLGWWWLALPALSLLIWRLSAVEGAWRAARAGWVAGAGYFAAAMFWIYDPFLVDPGDLWMAPFAVIGMAFGMGLFWALAAGLAVPLGGGQRGRALAFAVLLTATGLLRTYLFTGFPWALIGHIWIGAWPAQIAALGGAVLLSLMTALVAAAPVFLGLRRGLLFGLAVLGAAGGWGLWRLSQPVPARAEPVTIRLVQPNAAQDLKWREDMAEVFFDRMLKATEAPPAPGQPEPDLVVWPETSVPFLLNRPGAGLQMIAHAAHGIPVALGIERSEGDRYFNSMAILDSTGKVADVYDKYHLVPFGEYVPFGNLIYRLTGIQSFAADLGYGFTPGPGARVFDLGGKLGKLVPLICYETVFPQDVNAAPERASWLLQITNDGWFGTISGPYQHLAQARLRTIEQGLPMVRDANTGVSAMIDAKGRIVKEMPMLAEGFIDAALPPALPRTLYSRTGDWPIGGIVVLLLMGLAWRRFRQGH